MLNIIMEAILGEIPGKCFLKLGSHPKGTLSSENMYLWSNPVDTSLEKIIIVCVIIKTRTHSITKTGLELVL